jgi:aldehyde:ferredoxin oxidoreductase
MELNVKGYMGRVLVVDLATGEIAAEDVPDNVYENLLSGVGLGAYFLYRHIPDGADPLGPDNILGLIAFDGWLGGCELRRGICARDQAVRL